MTEPQDPQATLESLAAKPSLELRFRDADGNGVLDIDEFIGDDQAVDAATKLAEFVRFDENQDGVLDDDELKAGRQAQHKP